MTRPDGARTSRAPVAIPDTALRPPDGGPAFAVIVPAYDEAENMPDLFGELADTFRRHELNGEVVLVDDGSTDGTTTAAERAAADAGLTRVRFLRHRRNRGKTAAIVTAARSTSAPVFVLFDADLQHSTDEIPRFLDAIASGHDVVTGRKIGRYSKRFVSSIYNGLSRLVFRVPVHDLNSMKAFRREVLDDLRLREDWHRYLVVMAHAHGHSIGEIDIELLERRHGESKYRGSGRILVGTLDLLSVWFQVVFSRKPMLFFGLTGLGLFALGGLTGLIALYLRFVHGVGFRPLLTLVLLLVLLGGLLFVAGLIAELVAGLRAELEGLRSELREARSEGESEAGSAGRRERLSPPES
ncbi:MAG TPA: glycosyltransferase family 2 protein [Gemmatimonadota bacterium]|nr:glycosyltransferase family 2 protein [Gemmatimonadota bacterium]